MPGQPPQAYVDAYWADVAEGLERVHHAPPNEIHAAIAEFRQHMAPAGQTIYNDDPAEVAATMVGHGYFPSVPAVGMGLQLVFQLTDPNKVLDDPMSVAVSAAGLIDAVNDLERGLGGEGFKVEGAESYPGQVVVKMTPAKALGAADRLKSIAEQVQHASDSAADADERLTTQLARRPADCQSFSAVPFYQTHAA